jgi:hypothetical protein
MNAHYNWTNDEIIVAEWMKDMQRKAETTRLLSNAGLAETDGRKTLPLAKILSGLGERLKRKYTRTQQAHQATGGKYVV